MHPYGITDHRLPQNEGLCPIHPGAEKVKVKCPPVLEASYYREHESNFAATENVAKACGQLPIHAIFGTNSDVA